MVTGIHAVWRVRILWRLAAIPAEVVLFFRVSHMTHFNAWSGRLVCHAH